MSYSGVHAAPMTTVTDTERADIIETLAKHRGFLRYTVQGLTDEQAALRPTVSQLCLGGLIKHVTQTEAHWAGFIVNGPDPERDQVKAYKAHEAGFRMEPGETLAGLLDDYEAVATRTDALVGSLPSLDASQPLPEAPWFPPDTRWSARRVLLHVIAETSQHAGHADIVREAVDGQKTMG
jgi:hypothetical protein